MGDLTVYNKEEPKGAGARLVDLGYALKEGGAGFDDLDEAQAFLGAMMSSINELQGDAPAAILHIVSGAAEAAADRRIAEKLAELEVDPDLPPE